MRTVDRRMCRLAFTPRADVRSCNPCMYRARRVRDAARRE